MVHSCCVPFCTSTKRDVGISFHEFPADSALRELWLKNVSRKDFQINFNSPTTLVCSKHFQEDCYKPGLKVRKLRTGTVPTIFKGYPSYMQPKVTNKRRKIIKHELKVSPTKIKLEPKQEISTEDNQRQTTDNILPLFVSLDPQPSIPEFNTNTHGTNEEVLVMHLENFCTKETKDKSTQTKPNEIPILRKNINRLNASVRRRNEKLLKQQEQIESLKEELQRFKLNRVHKATERIIGASENGELRARFLKEQLLNFNKKKPNWSEPILRTCVLWNVASPTGYKHARNTCVNLPCRTTLKKHIAGDLIVERLKASQCNEGGLQQVSLEIDDEIARKPLTIFASKDNNSIQETEIGTSSVTDEQKLMRNEDATKDNTGTNTS